MGDTGAQASNPGPPSDSWRSVDGTSGATRTTGLLWILCAALHGAAGLFGFSIHLGILWYVQCALGYIGPLRKGGPNPLCRLEDEPSWSIRRYILRHGGHRDYSADRHNHNASSHPVALHPTRACRGLCSICLNAHCEWHRLLSRSGNRSACILASQPIWLNCCAEWRNLSDPNRGAGVLCELPGPLRTQAPVSGSTMACHAVRRTTSLGMGGEEDKR
jgi:hypothetical protein